MNICAFLIGLASSSPEARVILGFGVPSYIPILYLTEKYGNPLSSLLLYYPPVMWSMQLSYIIWYEGKQRGKGIKVDYFIMSENLHSLSEACNWFYRNTV